MARAGKATNTTWLWFIVLEKVVGANRPPRACVSLQQSVGMGEYHVMMSRDMSICALS